MVTALQVARLQTRARLQCSLGSSVILERSLARLTPRVCHVDTTCTTICAKICKYHACCALTPPQTIPYPATRPFPDVDVLSICRTQDAQYLRHTFPKCKENELFKEAFLYFRGIQCISCFQAITFGVVSAEDPTQFAASDFLFVLLVEAESCCIYVKQSRSNELCMREEQLNDTQFIQMKSGHPHWSTDLEDFDKHFSQCSSCPRTEMKDRADAERQAQHR